jgi:N utilization substance protein A
MNDDSTDTEMIWKLLRKHVPEVTSGVIKVLGIAREPGKRSAVAVASSDPRCDPVDTCVGLRGERVKRIVSDLGGREMFHVIRWDESTERFIANLLGPSCLIRASFDDATREARVTVAQPSGSRPPDLVLRSKLLMSLTGWRLHVEVKHED